MSFNLGLVKNLFLFVSELKKKKNQNAHLRSYVLVHVSHYLVLLNGSMLLIVEM